MAYSKDKRKRIIALWEDGRSTYEIAELLNISQTTAQRWVTRHKEGGDMDTWPDHGNRALPEDVVERLVQIYEENPSMGVRWVQLQSQSIVGRELDIKTIYNVLDRAGVRKQVPRDRLRSTVRRVIEENPRASDARVAAKATVEVYPGDDSRGVSRTLVAEIRRGL